MGRHTMSIQFGHKTKCDASSDHGYTGSSTKTRKTRVYDGGGPRVLHGCGKICGVLCGILHAGIWHTIALVPPLIAVVLWLRAAQFDPLRGPAYSCLHDSMRGLPRG
jgi:hypothetical protein